ncbi:MULTISPECIES: CII family transcriptional regulator [Yersinia]|uniref:CII family transcriptional regulator n=1 Tax=Yersinia TaxID=629 RepID=UPI001D0FE30F|nr:CII family transcriptional regulator [Yersinia proxima]
MERASNSKPTQRQIDRAETDLLINLSMLTQRGLAGMVGCHESKISRIDWRFMAAVFCAFGMASEISPISRAFQDAFGALTKQKSQQKGRDFEQITINF